MPDNQNFDLPRDFFCGMADAYVDCKHIRTVPIVLSNGVADVRAGFHLERHAEMVLQEYEEIDLQAIDFATGL